jgi:superoxide dismutase, Cu-Zn family
MHPNSINLLATGLALALATAAGAQDSPDETTRSPDGAVMARLVTADGTDVGKVTFQAMRAGVLVQVDLSGLPAGPHAIHIHEFGACEPDFSAAGEHLAPDGHEHGFAQTDAPHAGDLPNLIVAEDGTARAEFLNWRLTPEDPARSGRLCRRRS